jgi:hypothetical protein
MTSVFEAVTNLYLSKPIKIAENTKPAINQNSGGLPVVLEAPEKSDLEPHQSDFPQTADSRGFMSVYEWPPEIYWKSSIGSIMGKGENINLPSQQIQNKNFEPTESIDTTPRFNSESGSSSKVTQKVLISSFPQS